MKRTVILHTLIIMVVVMVEWLVFYPHTMVWLEGVSFFSTAPDFTSLQVQLPADIFPYCGAFLLQFFRWPLMGAFIMALLVWIVVMGLDVAVRLLTGRENLLFLSFVPTAYLVAKLVTYNSLSEPLIWCVAAWGLALAAWIFRKFRPLAFGVQKAEPQKSKKNAGTKGQKRETGKYWWVFSAVIPFVVLFCGATYSVKDENNRMSERMFKLEQLAENKDWDGILEEVPATDSYSNPYFRRYALLALFAKGQLADRMLEYGIQSGDEMIFANVDDSETQYFNTMVYEELGMDNEITHQMFQISATSPFGVSNRAMRRMIETFIRQGNYELAEKYLHIMRTTPFHSGWAKSRLDRVAIEKLQPRIPDPHDGMVAVRIHSPTPFISDIARILDAYPQNKRVFDLILTCLLASNDTNKFWTVLQMAGPLHYPEGRGLPRLFQEGLLVVKRLNNVDISRWAIDPKIQEDFNAYAELMDSRNTEGARSMSMNRYWNYRFNRN